MTNGVGNSRNFQISGEKDNGLSIYVILYRKFRLNSLVVILIVDGNNGLLAVLTKRTRGGPGNKSVCLLAAVPPVPGNFCYPACCSNVQCVHGVLAAHLSKSQKRADLKENLSSKRDMALIGSELHWQDSYASLL